MKRSSILVGLKNRFKLSKLGNQLTQVVRVYRSKPVKTKGEKKSHASRGKGGSLFKKAVVAFIVLPFILMLGFPGYKYFSLEIKKHGSDGREESKVIVGSRQNILLVIYDSDGRYDFVDSIALLSIDYSTTSARLLQLNPDFSTRVLGGGYIKVRNVMSSSVATNKDPILMLENYVEQTAGAQVDRYMAISTSNALAALELLGFSYTVPQAMEDSVAGSFALGENISGTRLAAYLAASEAGYSSKSDRNAKFFESFLSSHTNWLGAAKIIIQSEELASLLETNMPRHELLNLITLLPNVSSLRVASVGLLDTFLIEENKQIHYVINNSLIDEKLRQLYGLQRVAREQGRLEVYNATGVTGHATRYRRYLANLGANVIRAGNFPDREEVSTLYVEHPDRYLENVTLIKEVLRGNVIVREEPYPYNHSGELVLVLGSDSL